MAPTKAEIELQLKESQEAWLQATEKVRVLESELEAANLENDIAVKEARDAKLAAAKLGAWPAKPDDWRPDPNLTELMRLCREPFQPDQIGLKPTISCRDCSKAPDRCCQRHNKNRCPECNQFITTAHVHLSFVGHAVLTSRLLSIDPGFQWAPFALDEQGLPRVTVGEAGAALWINLTLRGFTRIGVGTADRGKKDTLKELIGDALRNAAMRFGIALDLWAGEALLEAIDWDVMAGHQEAPASGPQGAIQAPSGAPGPEADSREPRTPPSPRSRTREDPSPTTPPASLEEMTEALTKAMGELRGAKAKEARDRLRDANLWPLAAVADAADVASALAVVGEIASS